jgi:hypothetical protein
MNCAIVRLASACLLAAAGPAGADIQTMTQNQYVGTDLIALVTEPDFNAAVIDALETRAASLPGARMVALAGLIAQRAPDLVGLQEVYRFTCIDANPADSSGCQNQAIAGAFTDQLADTLAALGGRYQAAATVINLNLPATLPPPLNGAPGIPIAYDGQTIYVAVVDRDVVLARTGVPTTPVPFAALNALSPLLCSRPSGDGCNYSEAASASLQLPIPGLPPVTVRFERGFVGVDATVGTKPYRFVVTHLETRLESFGPQGRFFQSAQSAELIGTLQVMQSVQAQPATLLVGDFNSDPRDPVFPVPAPLPAFLGVPPYLQVTGAGFTDAWTQRPGTTSAQGAPLVGLSCCQDADLGNHQSVLYERVDLIFSSPRPLKVKDARLLGEAVGDKTLPKGHGLWPSDHASVAATLQFRP